MNRREFLKTTVFATAGSAAVYAFGRDNFDFLPADEVKLADLAKLSNQLEADFGQLLQWLKTNGWTAYLSQALGVDFNGEGDALKTELIKKLDKTQLAILRTKEGAGFDDFAGSHLIKPGYPAFSLLYHALASPRVRSTNFTAYPALAQIDLLEDYIYALYDFKQLKSAYKINADKELVLAVFAYEYRPAFKTPHHQHADMAYSRTGIARVGNQPMNYDAINRCFINKPSAEAATKQVAVTPARYGLFLAKKVKSRNVDVLKMSVSKPGDQYSDANDAAQWFLQPVRKLFNHDLLIGESNISFCENHRSEKIYKLFKSRRVVFADGMEPPILKSDYLIVQDTTIRNVGSGFLVISKEKPLIRQAKKGDQLLYFKVPKGGNYNTRYFNALNTQEVEDVELLMNLGTASRPLYQHNANGYNKPRNKPLFLNVTHVRSNDGYTQLQRDTNGSFENKINAGNYDSPLFEDSICDGCVMVNTAGINFTKLTGVNTACLPAFSIVTAPDFFPQVDCFDLLAYDIAPGRSMQESSFYEGGTTSLATLRMKPNPNILNSKDITYTAVLCSQHQPIPAITPQKLQSFTNPVADKGYFVSGFLPDVSSAIFAPGWDITYAGTLNDIYLSTEGLGSPFTEDMKLCAAMNGMWPVASPDAARTYQGGLEVDYRNTTAVPLMDDEIGFHSRAPRGDGFESFGWDGEQGPYLEKMNKKWKANFTDLGRADVVQNTLDGNLDMSKLRELDSKELITRMACLRLCIQKLPKKNFETKEQYAKMVGLTYHWLVSAEKVTWGTEDAKAYGIPVNLVGNSKDWITNKVHTKVAGNGYLFVFADVEKDNTHYDWADYKRRRLNCDTIYVCQVTETNIAWREILKGPKEWQM